MIVRAPFWQRMWPVDYVSWVSSSLLTCPGNVRLKDELEKLGRHPRVHDLEFGLLVDAIRMSERLVQLLDMVCCHNKNPTLLGRYAVKGV